MKLTANLNTDRFRNGDLIPEAKTNQEWINNSYVQHSADLKIDMIRFGLNYKY